MVHIGTQLVIKYSLISFRDPAAVNHQLSLCRYFHPNGSGSTERQQNFGLQRFSPNSLHHQGSTVLQDCTCFFTPHDFDFQKKNAKKQAVLNK